MPGPQPPATVVIIESPPGAAGSVMAFALKAARPRADAKVIAIIFPIFVSFGPR